jgi:hypothetical protein
VQPGQREPTGRRELPGLSEHQSGEPPNTVLTREVVVSPSLGGVAQLVERLTGSQEVRGFEPHRLHPKVPG